MKKFLFFLLAVLFFQTSAEPVSVSAADKTTVSQNASANEQNTGISKKYTFTPIPASISNASCQEFTLHFSNICTRTDLRTYSVTLKQNQHTFPCKLVSVSDNGTSAKYTPCQILPTGTYLLQGFSKIIFTISSSTVTVSTPTPSDASTEDASTEDASTEKNPSATAVPGTPIESTQAPVSTYSYTLMAETNKHEKIPHASVEIYLNHKCILSGKTDDDGVYHIETTVFQPDTTYTVRIYKLAASTAESEPESENPSAAVSFEPQQCLVHFTDTHSIQQSVMLFEPSETSPLPVTICWSLDAWHALKTEFPSVTATLCDTQEDICLYKHTYNPSITAMTAYIPLFEKECLKLPSGSYTLHLSISDDPGTETDYHPSTFIYELKLLHGEWITPVMINLP